MLEQLNVLIIGSGLMGGSMALALKGKCHSLSALETDQNTIKLAERMELFDRISSEYDSVKLDADLVILAVPVKKIIQAIQDLSTLVTGNVILLDLGSTKTAIVDTMNELPANFDPIGGHPMTGKEKSTLENADPAIYEGANFILTPLERTSSYARLVAEELVNLIGSHVVWMDEKTHDRWISQTSHLPYLISNSLTATTDIQMAPLIGPGFRSVSRLAASNQNMMLDIIDTNRGNILADLIKYRDRLNDLISDITNPDDDSLAESLREGFEKHNDLLENAV